MKTHLECLPCFLNQALKAMEAAGENKERQEKVLKKIMGELKDADLNKNPTEFARMVYDTIAEITGNSDPYKAIKKRDNENAIKLLPEMRRLIGKSNDKLLAAVKIAIAGNVMDLAVNSDYDVRKKVEEVIESKFAVDNYYEFREDVKRAKSIVYLADNSGEIVFDKLLVEKIREVNGCRIYFFVKNSPIVNDATETDAKFVGIDRLENVELKTAGMGFSEQSREFKEFVRFLKGKGLIISKGQGNYETLSEIDSKIYFLLIAKCKVIAEDLGIGLNHIVCKSGSSPR
ncbi:hypothetical protein DRN67_01905 [Candidatus Micrarchaeota archaeon]|nr:MAG: hypothetical protein DRN67_01905 [Candidatus Micrarchaeota archaeon]